MAKKIKNGEIKKLPEKKRGGVSSIANFTIQFSLKTEKYQEDILNKRFEIGRQIYNSLVNVTQKRYKEMIKTKNYRNLMLQLSGNKDKDKLI